MSNSVLFIVLIVLSACTSVFAHLHTHVGLNPDGIRGNADDGQLWIFATPGQPQWDTIQMTPTPDYIDGKRVYAAELDCWHSAHPASGLYQLDFNDESARPGWRISLKRMGFSNPADFWMEDEGTGQELLTSDGTTFSLGLPEWDSTLPDGKGGQGAWYFHIHTEFLALADGAGETFSATFSVLDTGTTGYLESAPYTIRFVTVPEPATLTLLGIGMVSALLRRRSL